VLTKETMQAFADTLINRETPEKITAAIDAILETPPPPPPPPQEGAPQ